MTGPELRALRLSLGWTQEQLAKAVGRKSDRTVHRWESGHDPIPPYVPLILATFTAPAT